MHRILSLLLALVATHASASVVINEFMARNRGAHTNAAGDSRADWIELRNTGALPVALTGWHLTDDPFNPAKWKFPTTTLPAGGYLLVYATSSVTNRVAGQLHANFSLGTDGEYLALVGADSNTVVDAITSFEYSPGQFGYPPQTENVSYGRNASNALVFFNPSTPGTVNGTGAADFVADTRFSHDRGFYSAPFDLTIACATPGAEIRYTTNGSPPTAASALYSGPIRIDRTSTVRARAFKTGLYPTNIDTHTYIYVNDVVRQFAPNNAAPGPGWPTFNVNSQVMQYGMDPDIVNHPAYSNRVDDALLAVPTISLVTDLANLFDASNGIYVNADQEGDLWERVTSVELLHPDGTPGFQVDSGLRMRGGASRGDGIAKHAFRLRFRNEYGAGRLDYPLFGDQGASSFNGIDLRCAQTPSWHFTEPQNHTDLRDSFSRDLQLACGQPSTRGFHFHLYLNGVYWGLYETQEKIEGEFASDYLGGQPEDYDVINKKKHGYTIDGSQNLYSNLWSMAVAGFSSNSSYFRAMGLNPDGVTRNPAYPKLLDAENLMDYMLITYYTGDKDGPASVYTTVNNYLATINRVNPDGFKHFEYDSEWSLGIGVENIVGPINRAAWSQLTHFNGHYLHERLVANAEYRLAFADRAHKRLFNDGLMTAAKAIPLLEARAAKIDTAIIAESARWGDSLNDAIPYTRDNHWVPAVNAAKAWMQNRTATVISQLRTAGWYPTLNAPVFSQHGGTVAPGFNLTMSGTGTIVYTLDGTDPRQIITGAARGQVYSGPLSLPFGVVVKARAMTATNNWSALNEAVFFANTPNPLRISEVMYNPRLPGGPETNAGPMRANYEFVELHNPTGSPVGLAGMTLRGRTGAGASFSFSGGRVASVPPNGHVLVVANLAAFAARYATNGLHIAGAFTGGLDDAGDTLELVAANGDVLSRFTYGDGREWPVTADGAGHSLVPLLPVDQTGDAMSFGGNWRASAFRDGSPGAADPAPVLSARLNEVEANTVYSNPTPPFNAYTSNDGIELHNPTGSPVDLSGWYLSDDADDLRKWRVPDGTVLAAGAWLWLTEVDNFNSPVTGGFGIKASGETLFLSHLPGDASDRVVDAVELEAQPVGSTWARLPDGTGLWQTGAPSRGSANTGAAPTVVINEVMHHPAGDGDLEYVELRNVSAQPVNLFNDGLTWRISGGIEFAIPTNITLAAGQALAVVPFDPADALQADEKAAFLAAYRQYEGETLLLGPYRGALDHHHDRLALERPLAPDSFGASPSYILVDEVTYTIGAPWPTGTEGTGLPRQRADSAASGNDPAAWYTPGFASPGLPDSKVDLLSPVSGSTLFLPQLATLSAGINTARVVGAVQHVTFLLDGQPLHQDTASPYQYTLTLPDLPLPGAHVLQARLRDGAGDHLSRPIPVQVVFADRISLVSPTNGQGLIPPYTAELIASIRPELVVGAVSQVEFFRNGTSIGVDAAPPYTWVVDQPVAAGQYAYTAVMTDAFARSTSAVVTVGVYTNTPGVDLSAAPDHTVRAGASTTLAATLNLNGLPAGLVSAQWRQISGPATAVLSTPNAPSTGVTLPVPGVYVFELVVRHGPHSQTFTRTITAESPGQPSVIRYAEDFERFLPGVALPGLGGWSAPAGTTAPMIVSTNYTQFAPGVKPIAYAAHARALRVEGMATNTFAGTQAFTNLWIDSVSQMTRWRNPTPPPARASAHLQLYVDGTGALRVWHKPDPVNNPSSNAWATVPGVTLADNSYHRLTVHANYQRDANGFFSFGLFLNGTAIPGPGVRYTAASTNQAWLTRLVMSGPFVLDDLVVDSRNPFTTLHLVRGTAQGNGSISPSANVFVESGGSQAVAITPDQFFHVADVLVNQVSMGAVTNLVLAPVTSDAHVVAVFAPDVAASGTPHWWLHQQNPAWAANFNAAAAANPDGDPLDTWEEYLAGTDPEDGQSYPWLGVTNLNAQLMRFEFPATPERRYRLQRKIGGLDGVWADLFLPFPGQPDGNGWMTVETTNGFDRVYYRLGIEQP